jgi:hypothetical protein
MGAAVVAVEMPLLLLLLLSSVVVPLHRRRPVASWRVVVQASALLALCTGPLWRRSWGAG